MRRIQKLVASTSLAALLMAPAAQAGVPTVDAAAIAEASRTATSAAQQVTKLGQIVSQANKMVSTLGSSGPGAFFLGSAGWGDLTGSNGSTDTAILSQLPHNLCAVRGCPDGYANTDKYSRGEINSVAEGVMFANESFYSNVNVTGDARRDFMTARRNAVREAAISGYSIALATRSALARTQEDSGNLERVVNEAGSLREDVQANSAALLALHRQMAQLQGLMASMLELQSAGAIASDGDLVRPGGVNGEDARARPRAYPAEDYSSAGGMRMRISPEHTQEMMGSSSDMTLPASGGGGNGSQFSRALGSITGDSTVASAAQSAGMSGGDALGSLLGVASTVARETGNHDIASGLSSMGRAAKSNDASGMFWSGAEAVASTSGNYQVRGLMRTAKSASRSNNPAEAENVLRMAQDISRKLGHSEATKHLRSVTKMMRGRKMDPSDAVTNAAQTVAQISGDQELNDYIDSGSNVLRSVDRNMTPQQRKRMFGLANDAIETSGTRAGNDKLSEVARAGREAGKTVTWDNPDTPQDESIGTSQGSAQPWDNPNTQIDESAR